MMSNPMVDAHSTDYSSGREYEYDQRSQKGQGQYYEDDYRGKYDTKNQYSKDRNDHYDYYQEQDEYFDPRQDDYNDHRGDYPRGPDKYSYKGRETYDRGYDNYDEYDRIGKGSGKEKGYQDYSRDYEPKTDDYAYDKRDPNPKGRKLQKDSAGQVYYQRIDQDQKPELSSTASYHQSSRQSHADSDRDYRKKKFSDDFSDDFGDDSYRPKPKEDNRGSKRPREAKGRDDYDIEDYRPIEKGSAKGRTDRGQDHKGREKQGEYKQRGQEREPRNEKKPKYEKPKEKTPVNDKYDFSKKSDYKNDKDKNQAQDYKDDFDDEEYLEMEDYEPVYEKENATYSSNEECIAVMIAEKPSIALSIAKALGGAKFTQRKGRSPICPVYQYRGKMMGHSNVLFKVTSVAGHVYSRDFPKQYADWQRTDPLDLFDAETVLVEANPKNRIVDHVKHECKNASFVVLWLDNDREGENICFEILSAVTPLLKKENFKQVYRAVFSSLAPTDLQEAFRVLNKGPNRNESISVDARQIIDLKIGVVFSRFQSLYFGEKYSKLSGNKITYGPCQTPTLGFCVFRQLEIERFKPEKYFGVTVNLKIGSRDYQIPYTEEKRMNRTEAERVKKEIEENRSGTIKSIEKSEKKRGKPEGLNTVEMLKHASTYLGIGPHDTMRIAERLYLSGYITYPRTESTSYPTNFEFKAIVDKIKESYSSQPTVKSFAGRLQINKPKKGVDVGDHPPITPTTKIPSESMNYVESK
jgi:DNA topoisomerase IA